MIIIIMIIIRAAGRGSHGSRWREVGPQSPGRPPRESLDPRRAYGRSPGSAVRGPLPATQFRARQRALCRGADKQAPEGGGYTARLPASWPPWPMLCRDCVR